MKILIRQSLNDAWQLVETKSYGSETELQKLLADEPSLISISEVNEGSGPLIVAIKEFPVSIGSIDILGFTEDGNIAVVECKLAKNPEIKRQVIAQVLEYGAGLWGLDYKYIDAKVASITHHSLADLIREKVDNPGWDEEVFKNNVNLALEQGNFTLLIVVDEVSDELNRIINYINQAGKPAFSFAALEMRRYQSGSTEMLIPHIVGVAEQRKSSLRSESARHWDELSYFEDAAKHISGEETKIVRELYDWSIDHADKVKFGVSTVLGSFTFYFNRNDSYTSIFSVLNYAQLVINIGFMSKNYSLKEIERFKERLAEIPSFSKVINNSSQFIYFDIVKTLSNPEFLEKFKQAVIELIKGSQI